MKRIATVAVFAWMLAPHVAPAQTRSEVPIREIDLSDGVRRYAVSITVGTTAIEAGLDSGSTGLRILPNTLHGGDAKASTQSNRYSYGSGTRFDGVVGSGTVAIGPLSGASTLQLIEKVGCVESRPHCPASRVPLDRFGIQGDGNPGEGFRAILGVNMVEAEVQNPLAAIGAQRWIIELPRPDSGTPGKLVLNPTDDEVKDFTLVPLMPAFQHARGDLHDAVRGCVVNDRTREEICAPVTLDTGAPGIFVPAPNPGEPPWTTGTSATLTFLSGERPMATERFTVGLRNHASRLTFEPAEPASRAIRTGLLPYFAFTVLYVPDKNVIGLKPRPDAPDAPKGVVRDRSD